MDENTKSFSSQADLEVPTDRSRSRGGTFGPAYRHEIDAPRISTQQERIRIFMLQNSACDRWLTLGEIRSGLESRWTARFPESSLASQLRHLRKRAFGSYQLTKRRRGGAASGIYEYQLTEPNRQRTAQSEAFTRRKTGLALFDAAAVDR